MEFKRLGLFDVEYIIDCIDEIFGKKVMFYNEAENMLVLQEPIWFPEAPEVKMVGIGMLKEDGKLMFKMLREDGHIYYINGIEI